MHGDRVCSELADIGRHVVAVGELACQRGAANREVDVGHRARDPGVVEHCSQVQELTVERDPVKCGDGRPPRVGTTGMVEEGRCQQVLRGDLGISCERGVGRHQARRIDGAPASRVHSERHRETTGKDAELPPQQGPGQCHAFPSGQHTPGAFGPSDGSDRIGGSWLARGDGGHREPASEANGADDVAWFWANASMRWAMNCASSLTQPSRAEPRVCCQSRPRKYTPGMSVTPRWWRTLDSSLKTGSCTKEWSSRNPVAHTTPSTVSSDPSANVTTVRFAAVTRGRSWMPSSRAARGLEPMSVSLSFR